MQVFGRRRRRFDPVDADGNVIGDPLETSTVSFWVSGLCSPFVTFGQRAEDYLKAAVRVADPERPHGDQYPERRTVLGNLQKLGIALGNEQRFDSPRQTETSRPSSPWELNPSGALGAHSGQSRCVGAQQVIRRCDSPTLMQRREPREII